jgi:hypothetical protein
VLAKNKKREAPVGVDSGDRGCGMCQPRTTEVGKAHPMAILGRWGAWSPRDSVSTSIVRNPPDMVWRCLSEMNVCGIPLFTYAICR